jgi:fructose-bisphosphate aldolase, class II
LQRRRERQRLVGAGGLADHQIPASGEQLGGSPTKLRIIVNDEDGGLHESSVASDDPSANRANPTSPDARLSATLGVSVPDAAQYADMLDAAAEGGYAYPAVNVTSSETLNAALRGFAEAESDGIVELTTGAAAYLSGAGVGHGESGARALAAFAREVASGYGVLVALHTDHCPPEQLDAFVRPLLAESVIRRERGDPPLFNSHMFDGSSLPLEENLRISSDLLAECARAGVVLELECGVVGGAEDNVSGEGAECSRLYTTTEDLLRVAEVLGTGERGRYLLAATFGNVHGRYAPGAVELRPEILRDGQDALAGIHPGARFQYVFHGSSGSSEKELRDAVRYGVVKVNVDTDMQFVFTRAVADHVRTHDLREKEHFDPRSWGRAGEAAMANAVAEQCALVGSAGRTLARS